MAKRIGNSICAVILCILCLGAVLELVGGLALSQPQGVGMNLNLSPVMIAGCALIVVGCIAHIVVKCLQKRLAPNPDLLDIEAIVAIVAIFFAVIFLACTIVWPVLFPTNG